jgi:DNA-binding MarR family transcriptional regulator
MCWVARMHPLAFLHKRTHLCAVARGREMFARIEDMTPARFDFLYIVFRGHHFECGIRKRLGLARQTVWKMSKRLEELGLITRTPLGSRFRVQFTDKGRVRIRQAIHAAFTESYPLPPAAPTDGIAPRFWRRPELADASSGIAVDQTERDGRDVPGSEHRDATCSNDTTLTTDTSHVQPIGDATCSFNSAAARDGDTTCPNGTPMLHASDADARHGGDATTTNNSATQPSDVTCSNDSHAPHAGNTTRSNGMPMLHAGDSDARHDENPTCSNNSAAQPGDAACSNDSHAPPAGAATLAASEATSSDGSAVQQVGDTRGRRRASDEPSLRHDCADALTENSAEEVERHLDVAAFGLARDSAEPAAPPRKQGREVSKLYNVFLWKHVGGGRRGRQCRYLHYLDDMMELTKGMAAALGNTAPPLYTTRFSAWYD